MTKHETRTKLSVNINKLATLRNARGKNNPDILWWAREIERMGVHGITVHPRPDERHIRFSDVRSLATQVFGEFNIEGYPDEAWLKLVAEASPDQATLVPDPPDAITSNAGFDVKESEKFLAAAVARLAHVKPRSGSSHAVGRAAQIRISVFIDPRKFSREDAMILKKIGVHRIELYTEEFAEAFALAEVSPTVHDSAHADEALARVTAIYRQAATLAREAGLGVNAGHDLTSENLATLVRAIPWIDEVSIGHALICDALQLGMRETIHRYLISLES